MTPRSIRRYVTGFDARGRSVVLDARDIAECGGARQLQSLDDRRRPRAGCGADALPFFPRDGQTVFRIFRIPPAEKLDRAALEAIAEGFFADIGDPRCRVDTSRHPLMHVTPTVDYIMLLSGEAELWLDEGDPVPLKPLDSVVQRGVNHTWVNKGAEDAVFMAVHDWRGPAMNRVVEDSGRAADRLRRGPGIFRRL